MPLCITNTTQFCQEPQYYAGVENNWRPIEGATQLLLSAIKAAGAMVNIPTEMTSTPN